MAAIPTIKEAEARAALLSRLGTLSAESQLTWGTLSAPHVLCHLADRMRVGLGDIPSQPRARRLGRALLRWLVVHSAMQAPPGRVQTVPEMLAGSPTS